MKKFLLPMSILAVSFTSGAQTYFEENFDGGLGQFTSVDNDGDGNEWSAQDLTGGPLGVSNVALSSSWIQAGPLTPDNLLTSSLIDLSSATGSVFLQWQVGNPETTNNWWEENYDVYVTTSNTTADILAATSVFNETLPNGGAMLNRSVDLTSYVGQSVYVTFRHHNCTDENYMALEDVVVKTVSPVDMAMSALTMSSTVVAGNVNVTGTVKNEGADPISTFDIIWDDGSGANSETVNQTLNAGETYDFTHVTPLNAVSGNTYNLTVSVAAANDGDNANDALTTSVGVVSSLVSKVTVGEEKTGEWCGWCPRGGVALAEMELSNPNDFIGIAVHNGDGMVVSSYDSNIGTYVPGGYPGGGVDRVLDGDPSSFSTMHGQRVTMIAPASVSVTKSYDGTNVTVEVEATFVGGLSGDYRLAAVLTEDNVSGAGQANYYNDGGAGALAMPNTGSMANFDFVGGGATVTPYYHDHTARALGGDEINGVAGSLPATMNDGDVLSYTYTIPQDAAWDMNNVHAVGMLVNGTTGEILNAGSEGSNSLNEVGAVDFNAIAVPNPTSGMSNLIIDLEVAADVAISVKNVLGQEVFVSNTDKLSAGSYTTAVDLSNQPSGVYFAKVVVNGQVQIVKINVAK